MSGLEPLAALGLACNIFQLIEVGCNTIKLAKSIYQSSSPAVDKALQDNAVVLRTISGEIKAVQRPASLSKVDKQLVATADKCFSAARDLEEEVRFLLSNATQNQLAATLKVVAKTTWRRRRLDRLKENLENAEKLMEKTLLAQIWSRTHAAKLDLSNVKDDLRAFIQQYQSGSRDIKQLISSESLMTRAHISASSKETIDAIGGVQKQVNRLTLEANIHIDQTKRDRLLRSLKFPGFMERRNQVSEAHGSTFEWVFVGDDGPSHQDLAGSDREDSDLDDLDVRWDLFPNWLSSTGDIYWISGKPGSGKTTLVKYVLKHPRTTTYLNTWSPQALIVSHFFWRPGTRMQQSIKGLLCSLLYQLLDNSVAATDCVLQDIQARSLGMKDEDTDWSVPELRSILLQTLSSYKRPICIFIDGLDEVLPTDGPTELLDLVQQFSRCRNAKLCLSSRPEPVLEERLSAYPHLRLQELTRSDLTRYARDHMKLTGSVYDQAQSSNSKADGYLIDLLVDKAEGVFLWLILATKSLNNGFRHGDTGEMIRQRIDSLPGDLTRLYKDMWNRACEDNPAAYRQIGALYFRLILLGQSGPGRRSFFFSSLLHLMLASTSVADQLLDAIDNPIDLVPEERLLKYCETVERRLKLYCFGLIEITPMPFGSDVVGWYGSQYNTLWSRYGRKRPWFIHRTAHDFLLDTVDGTQILKHNSTSQTSLSFTWFRAHLAISQLYAGTPTSSLLLKSLVYDYIDLLDHFPRGDSFSGGPDRARTISYLKDLCISGQLLSGSPQSNDTDNLRFCGGVDFLKIAARICEDDLLSKPRISTLSTTTLSEILLNVENWKIVPSYPIRPPRSSPEPLIKTLLSEGADPNWRGTMFDSWIYHGISGFSQVTTPFTEFLNTVLTQGYLEEWSRFTSILTISRILHGFLSHSAHLGDMIHRAFLWHPSRDIADGFLELRSLQAALDSWYFFNEDTSLWDRSYLLVAFPAYTVVKALLGHLDTQIEHSRHAEQTEYGEVRSLLVSNREYLDNWSKWEHGHVIGRLAYKEFQDSNNKDQCDREPAWYLPLEGHPNGIVDELMGELEKCLMDSFVYQPRKVRIIAQLVQQLPWTLQASDYLDTLNSLTELGVVAKADHETLDIQGWVDRFQEQLLANGKNVNEIEVAQGYIGKLATWFAADS